MTIYEPEDFGDIWKPDNMKHNRAVDKLKRIRKKQREEKEANKNGIPTSEELKVWFSREFNANE